jgi:hypothetical protein
MFELGNFIVSALMTMLVVYKKNKKQKTTLVVKELAKE